ncbi:MAG TPA: hypothetical protein VNT53_00995 [Pseudolysinimonas sp.]|nr:hypothetical protein [Pseudolysinimonas sp.]
MSRTIVPVWLATLVGVFLVAFIAGSAYLTWLPVGLAGAFLLTSVIQLALHRKEGLVSRMVASTVGALVILGIATAALALVHR